jgi:subtilisin family serine protease
MARSLAGRSSMKFGLPALALALVAAMAAGPASAAPSSLPDETAIKMNFTINSDTGSGVMRDVKRAVQDAGGTVLSQYAQIGVTVAVSSRGAFVQDLRGQSDLIQSVGATRTVAVDFAADARKMGYEESQTPQIVPEPRESEQWGNTKLESLAANEIEDGRKSVVVGILDTGVNDQHEDLKANFNRDASVDCVSGDGVPNTEDGAWRPTSSTHATHVAGTIAAARNGIGIAGIAPGVSYSSIKVVDDNGFIYPEYAICGFMWAAAKGVEVTNNSYYIDPWYFWCANDPDQGAVKESIQRAIAYSQKKGVINVAAAGNENYDLANKTTDTLSPDDSTPISRPVNRHCLDLPTEHKGVITTSAIQQNGTKASFSNYGRDVIDVAAPGVNILSTVWPGDSSYGTLSGTSMASPHVAGVVALIESTTPGLSINQMLQRLYDTSVDTPCGGASGCTGPADNNSFYGHGVVNALNAVS